MKHLRRPTPLLALWAQLSTALLLLLGLGGCDLASKLLDELSPDEPPSAASASAPTTPPQPSATDPADTAPDETVERARVEVRRQAGAAEPSPPAAQPPSVATPAQALLRGPPIRAVDHVEVRGLDGQIAFRGRVDLGPTIDRVLAGSALSHRNDGSIFENRERRLPIRPRGHYREYVHPTPGLRGPGPQRLVVGQDGAWYYTPDHYRSFRPLQESPP